MNSPQAFGAPEDNRDNPEISPSTASAVSRTDTMELRHFDIWPVPNCRPCPQLPPSWTPSAVPRQVLAACCFLKEEKRFDPQTQKSLRLGTGSMFDDVGPHLDGSFNI
jgi:hypothetical protein